MKTRKITVMGILLAMTMVLSTLEHMLPPIPGLPPNTRLGIANVIVMYTLFFLGFKYAFTMAVLKSLFVALTRGMIAGFMSFGGSVLSVIVMAVFAFVFRDKISYLFLSVLGALSHNIGQMIVASFQLGVNMVKIYWPLLLISGIVFGIITGIMLRIVMPIFDRISGISKQQRYDASKEE